MILPAIVGFELILLFALTNHLLSIMYTILMLIFRNQHIAVGIITFLYLPGTVVHELAHLIVAEVLRVRTGEISFTPTIERREDGSEEIKAGHVQIAQSDPIRRYLIGFAPIGFGLFFLSLLIWVFNRYWPQMTELPLQIGFVLLIGYLLFTISNNMFSSRTDLEGFIWFVPVMVIIAAAAYIAGLRIDLTGQIEIFTNQILSGLARALGIVIGINLLILLINGVVLRGILKVTHRRLL